MTKVDSSPIPCILASLACFSPIIFLGIITTYLQNREYHHFLKQQEGMEFFCYTNRQNSKPFVEKYILPSLDPGIKVVYLEGKKPISQYDEAFISRTLYHIKEIGFPNVMKIKNGRVLDKSLHHELYNIVNQGKSAELFLVALNQKLGELRTED